MRNLRIIPRLDIKGPNLIKGIHLEGLRVIGDPFLYAKRYYEAGADELIYMDIVASLYGRNSLTEIIRHTASELFIPLTVGGGIRTIKDVKEILRCGADKVAINTAAILRPKLLTEISETFGSQCTVLSIEAKRTGEGSWEAYYDNGREHSNLDVLEWARYGVELGVGEILVTSIDKEGTRKGYDFDLLNAVTDTVSIPVIASGGMGKVQDMLDVAVKIEVDGFAMADILHYDRCTIQDIRKGALAAGLPVRKIV